MRIFVRLYSCLLLLSIVSGCWNSKDVQNLGHVTAIGLDYQNGEYITYIQVLNFTNIGRTESLQIGRVIPIWIGTGRGETINQSLNSIYATAQMRVSWGHVKVIVSSESVLKKGLQEVYSAFNRSGDIRYNILVYGTNEEISNLFVQKSIFNLSPLDTIMYSAEQIYAQRSSILPVRGNRFIAQLNEPGGSAMLPSLAINKTVWKEDKKIKPMLRINGAYFFEEMKMAAWLSEGDLAGARWTQRELKRSLINIPAEGPATASLVLSYPRYRIKPHVQGEKVWFDIELHIRASLEELIDNASIQAIEEQAEKVVRDEIVKSYLKGIEQNVDVLKLEVSLYRNHPRQWKALRSANKPILDKDSLRNIHVKVHLKNTGKYKGKTR